MILIKIILRVIGLLFRIVGLGMKEDYSGWSGFLIFLICVAITYSLPKSQKEKDEELIRKLQLEKLKKSL